MCKGGHSNIYKKIIKTKGKISDSNRYTRVGSISVTLYSSEHNANKSVTKYTIEKNKKMLAFTEYYNGSGDKKVNGINFPRQTRR